MIRKLYYIIPLTLFCGCHIGFTPHSHEENIWQHTTMAPAPSFETTLSTPCNATAEKIVALAQTQTGTPYRYGGMDDSGFDCSGFVCWVYENATGRKLPHSARLQSEYVEPRELSELQKGDLLFFDTSGKGEINHCGIYLGEGKFIHASSGKANGVTISDMTKGFYKEAFRWGGTVKGIGCSEEEQRGESSGKSVWRRWP